MADINSVTKKPNVIVLQNIDTAKPIQLKIDSPTDYYALGITVTVSLITAIVSAIVTIYLVDKSNKRLIDSQNEINRRQLESQITQQKNDVINRNIEERINNIRNLMAEYIALNQKLMPELPLMTNTYIFKRMQNIEGNQYIEQVIKNTELRNTILKMQNLIELTLNKDNTLDNEIINHMKNIKKYYDAVNCYLNNEAKRIIASDDFENFNLFNVEYLSKNHPNYNDFYSEIELIKEKTKLLLENLWSKLRN
ncbi:hypothetical protein ACT41N_00725 [Acinetobacter baumannii]|nr:hypothetical protein [Acinetobacter baumannii]HEN9595349.1 hypothetical protein [Acinetobacter baumannii]